MKFSIAISRGVNCSHKYCSLIFAKLIQRNGLIHMDVSAKSGTGIDDLIHQLIDIALKEVEENDGMTAEMNKKLNDLYCTTLKRNDELDLHRRYGPKSRSCFPHSCCNKDK